MYLYYIVSSHNLLNILKNVQHVDDFPQEKASISWWTSNDDQYARNFKFRTNRYEYFDQCYSHCEITYIFPSQIKEDRDVEKNVCSESMLRNLQICRTAAYLNLISTTTSSAHACIE